MLVECKNALSALPSHLIPMLRRHAQRWTCHHRQAGVVAGHPMMMMMSVESGIRIASRLSQAVSHSDKAELPVVHANHQREIRSKLRVLRGIGVASFSEFAGSGDFRANPGEKE